MNQSVPSKQPRITLLEPYKSTINWELDEFKALANTLPKKEPNILQNKTNSLPLRIKLYTTNGEEFDPKKYPRIRIISSKGDIVKLTKEGNNKPKAFSSSFGEVYEMQKDPLDLSITPKSPAPSHQSKVNLAKDIEKTRLDVKLDLELASKIEQNEIPSTSAGKSSKTMPPGWYPSSNVVFAKNASTQTLGETKENMIRRKIKESFEKMYTEPLKFCSHLEIIKPNFTSASGVLLAMIAGKSFFIWMTSPEIPIEFVKIVCNLPFRVPEPDWISLFESDLNTTKKAWNELLGDESPFENSAAKANLVEAIGNALRIRKSNESIGFYARKLEFCIYVLINGSCNAQMIDSPVEFSETSREFWNYVRVYDGFKKPQTWKLPADWGDWDLPQNVIDTNWDDLVKWMRTDGNYRVINVEFDKKSMMNIEAYHQELNKDQDEWPSAPVVKKRKLNIKNISYYLRKIGG